MNIIFEHQSVTIKSETLGEISSDSLLMYQIAKILAEESVRDYPNQYFDDIQKDKRVITCHLDGE